MLSQPRLEPSLQLLLLMCQKLPKNPDQLLEQCQVQTRVSLAQRFLSDRWRCKTWGIPNAKDINISSDWIGTPLLYERAITCTAHFADDPNKLEFEDGNAGT